MLWRGRRRWLVATAGLVAILLPGRLRSCLCPEISDRAIQWSSAIVNATLVAIEPRVELPTPATQPADQPVQTDAYRIWKFEVTESIDGPLRA
ncbi:MAG: hypothetical protein ACREJC_21295, partial [Tepidisphaeraceae bacterium]